MKSTIFLFLFLNMCVMLSAQDICQGNLGENIFSIGDFGSGEDNIVQINPDIAPGYSYTTNPPPADGFYIITNDMNAPEWANLYGTWLRIQDNSDDPNGYMMVVNASFQPGIFYEEIVDGLCENTLYEFSADVINLIAPGVTGHHEPNLSFLLDDEVQYTSGIIPQDATWHKQGFTFTTDNDQTSVKLTLRNNAPGGIGNDLALDNISFRPCGPDAFANAAEEFVLCANDLDPISITADTDAGAAIQWQFFDNVAETWDDITGATDVTTFHNIFEPGEYFYRYLSAGNANNLLNDKCRVISDIAVVTVLPIEFTVYDTICENVAYEFGSQSLTAPGFYEETFIASTGCDSFVDLFLEHQPDPNFTFETSALDPSCFGFQDGSISITIVNGGSPPYIYSFGDEIFGGVQNDLSAGQYSLKVSDRFSCMSISEVVLLDPAEFTVSLGMDTIVEFGAIYDFNIESSQDIVNGLWSGDETNCPNCVSNSAQPFTNSTYVFTADNFNGCLASDSINVQVKELGELFYQPTIFSPNEDGFNDIFDIYSGTQAITSVRNFSVFDRYGNRVYHVANRDFQSQDYGWDGLINGSPAVQGVYTYFYTFELINQEVITIKGDVTLVR